jgi:molybdopterin synthase catalytic subunit
MSARLSPLPLDPAALRKQVEDPSCGAVLVFEGVARASSGAAPHRDRPVTGLFYEAWEPVAERELATLEAEALERWPEVRAAIRHRLGAVAIGEPAVVVAVGAPHRDTAYAASRWLIDTLKLRVPIWKKEIFPDGDAWIGNRP